MAIINAVEVTFQLTTTAPAGQKAPAGAFDPAEFEYRHTFNGVTTTEKGKTNDQLRQTWLSTAVPFCESIGIEVPAHHDAARDEYVIDCAFPQQFDEREKRWLAEEGEISWDEVLERWRRRGPANEELVEMIQRGRVELAEAA